MAAESWLDTSLGCEEKGRTAIAMITLLTDFGDRDTYVGVMKGVIASINPRISVVDLTHQIPPQDCRAAQFHLSQAYPYFPADTIHLAVVDPGVGSQRRAIAIATSRGYFVGPDNGLFSGILEAEHPIAIVELNNPQYWYTQNLSQTFHGRDIFAPVAAHLASGVPIAAVGTTVDFQTLVQLCPLTYTLEHQQILGQIQHIDHFGNLITNIPAAAVQGWNWQMEIEAGKTIPTGQRYSDVENGETIALIGSHSWVELAVNQGNAGLVWNLGVGSTVRVRRFQN